MPPPVSCSLLAAFAASFTLAPGAQAQVPNDDCSGAIPLSSGFHTVAHLGATDSGFPSNCVSNFGIDLWYSYTAPVDEIVYLTVTLPPSTCGVVDPNWVEVFDSDDCSLLTTLVCAEGPCVNGGAMARFFAAAGSTHLFHVGGLTNSPEWTIDIAPYGQDHVLGALPAGAGSTPFDTTGATLGLPELTCNAGAGADIWYLYTADCDGPVDIELCGSTFDTVLEVRDWPVYSTSYLCNDDACGLQSAGTLMAQEGEDYLIQIGGVGSATGTGTLVISPPDPAPNPTCATATPVGLGSTPFTNYCTPSPVPTGSFNCGIFFFARHGVWFRYTAPCSGVTTIDTCGSELSTFLAVHDAGPCGASPIIACAADTCGDQSDVSFMAVAGSDYLVHVAGRSNGAVFLGTGVLNIQVDEALGFPVCEGVANTTGLGARFTMSGCDIAADNAVLFKVDQLPTNSNGFFVNSRDVFTVLNPGGSVGNLCIASLSMGRHSGDVLNSGTSGEVEWAPNLSVLPWPGGAVPAAAGETWYWQYWYRDSGATSNFSSARGITFQ